MPLPGPSVALVAGGSRGLGLAVARELLSRGWRVHVAARDAAELERLAHEATAGLLRTHVVDVADAEAVGRLVGAVVEADGRVDAAFHVAGTIQVGALESVTLGHVEEAIGTMLWGPVHLSLAVLPAMRRQGRGRIGVVSSVGGLVAVPRLLPYSIAKFGAVGLAEGLAAELAGTGVTVTSVTPWLMRTGGHEHAHFTGDGAADHAWFAPGASLPGLTVPAERAARRIVDGVLAGRVVVDTSPLPRLARVVHGLAPATTVRALGLAARVLPGAAPRRDWRARDAPHTDGHAVAHRRGDRVLGVLTAAGRRAARRLNQPAARPTPEEVAAPPDARGD
ncbi:SDR family NAD(P)-dependent oxidoreductase [Phycicoccus endophyticus]|uniref:SDR family NAD(P)-dependent oxidoreductase n=1 Tax=Phycicoccus endophyticus TaxID=1690220 RepID=A0A7G9R4R8_9MICO|nr:SDR family NAD(P)-dependent oxidoreductase [Phycicoccus endophyticus]NHI18510.1 SDR family NAD(P)-dependent oxidoreductase [Phycicoccus endophyticus]QNN50593.1 SDR family NAD(P)-dependent oxidoreductase [Phycicoccus endophyticus]GGL23190.1 ketoacyl reductase [Phycicoccus endophyticus]